MPTGAAALKVRNISSLYLRALPFAYFDLEFTRAHRDPRLQLIPRLHQRPVSSDLNPIERARYYASALRFPNSPLNRCGFPVVIIQLAALQRVFATKQLFPVEHQ
jgi:hypothetical protein